MLYSVRSCGIFVSSIKIESGGETAKTWFKSFKLTQNAKSAFDLSCPPPLTDTLFEELLDLI